MIAPSIDKASLAELDALQRALTLYQGLSRKGAIEATHKKADDLRIQLYKGFASHKWRGSRKGSKRSRGVAFVEMRQRARQGRGTKLRAGITASASAPLTDKHGRTLTTHQRLVWSELARRQSGQNVLAVAFLMRRWRSNSQGRSLRSNVSARIDTSLLEATHQQRDRQGKRLLGEVRLTTNGAELSGFVEGHQQIAQRYGIVPAALRSVRADTEIYLRRKLGDYFADAARSVGLRPV
jgi:hypothetical protein